ncbi:MAG TPA: MBL fold metallo-hydrolase, partial [Mycobacteriales bacterium]|nr:MBL fold metallo-hydrolase [Mycobacteriales bacterium]
VRRPPTYVERSRSRGLVGLAPRRPRADQAGDPGRIGTRTAGRGSLTGAVDFVAGAPVAGDLAVRWIHGSRSARHDTGPAIQAHRVDPHTFVLRQNKAVHYEAPFLYLFCGNDRALLLDTGATAEADRFPLRATVEGILDDWLAEHPRNSYELVVAHTHAHGDHVAADPQFADRPATTVVGLDVDAVRSFFGFTDWPAQVVTFDLGGRVLEVTGCPGHHDTSIAVYDRWSGFLVTGDTVYPGRLYVRDFPAFTASLDRLVALAGSRPVIRVMGCHVEMTRRPGRDFPIGATYQPGEAALPMTTDQLVALRDAARSVADRPGVHVFDDFVIFHGRCRSALPRYLARALWGRLRNRVTATLHRSR